MRPPNLDLVADRRAREGQHLAPPSAEVRGEVSRTIGGSRARTTAEARPAGAGLTSRERRVKAILLKELTKLNQGLSYAEKKKLEQSLDHTFIDAELAKLRGQERAYEGMAALAVPLALVSVVGVGVAAFMRQPFGALFPLLFMPAQALASFNGLKAVRRKRFIYEALRELSDAEDEGVQLNDTVALADLLIDRLEAGDEAARTPPRRTRA